jgi:hypothetical protein
MLTILNAISYTLAYLVVWPSWASTWMLSLSLPLYYNKKKKYININNTYNTVLLLLLISILYYNNNTYTNIKNINSKLLILIAYPILLYYEDNTNTKCILVYPILLHYVDNTNPKYHITISKPIWWSDHHAVWMLSFSFCGLRSALWFQEWFSIFSLLFPT